MSSLKLGFFAFVPILVGYIYNNSMFGAIIGALFYWTLPFIQLLYWFWVGRKFVLYVKNPIIAILLGHSFGIISFLIYYWQFIILSDENRNLFLSGFSQMFFSSLTIITARFFMMFNLNSYLTTQTLLHLIHIIGIVLMIIVFSMGYLYESKSRPEEK